MVSTDDVLIIGAGVAGLCAALELLNRGRSVCVLDRGSAEEAGGLGRHAFGGMALVGTPLQRWSRIPDTPAIALRDWLSFAEFGPDDHWPRRWAEHYVERSVAEVYEGLGRLGLRFIPMVQWVERGDVPRGNSLPRYHVLWGTGRALVDALLAALRKHPAQARLSWRWHHRVDALCHTGRRISGCTGIDERNGQPFELHGAAVVAAGGGLTGDLARVRQHWPATWGHAPDTLLNGSHPHADGRLHDAVARLGGRLTHLDWMWNYAAGVRHPRPHFDGHGLSLIPARSALWLDPQGHRIGPQPLVTGFDTHEMVGRIARAGWPWTWQVLNRRMALRELAASGAEHNPHIRDRRPWAFLAQLVRGQHELVDELRRHCPDVVEAADLPALAAAMNGVTGDDRVSESALRQAIAPYDEQIGLALRYRNDDQLRRIEQLRRWPGDRVRTCRAQALLEPGAGPLMAIRCQLLTRKSMGGMQTDLDSRVLACHGEPIDGLYAIGEAAGFGGGGASGRRSLEGTFLPGCILTARAAARHLGR